MPHSRFHAHESERDEEILNAAIRNRLGRVSDLAEFLALPHEQVLAAVQRLHTQEIIICDGDRIRYSAPTLAAVTQIDRKLAAHTKTLHGQLDKISGLNKRLRATIDIKTEHPTSDIMGSTVFRGIYAGQQALQYLLRDLQHPTTPQTQLLGMMPRSNPPNMTPHEQIQLFQQVVGLSDHMQLLLSEAPAAVPETDLLKYTPQGVSVRWFDSSPSWMWINAATKEAAIPMVWGEIFPTTVIVFSHPVVYLLASELFMSCWRVAVPAGQPDELAGWESLLLLMRSGLTLESAAHRLGVTPRTARRRLEKGMQHFQVETLFSLSAAWSASLTGGSIPFPAQRTSFASGASGLSREATADS